MRTTLTLDDHLLQTLKREAAERNVSFKTMVHQALQIGPRALEQKPGYDLDTLGRMADEQADVESVGRAE